MIALTIFLFLQSVMKNIKLSNWIQKEYRYKGAEELLTASNQDLMKQNWDEMCQKKDNEAHEVFLRIFTLLYKKNCPTKQ